LTQDNSYNQTSNLGSKQLKPISILKILEGRGDLEKPSSNTLDRVLENKHLVLAPEQK
jgi:hypothetical protein